MAEDKVDSSNKSRKSGGAIEAGDRSRQALLAAAKKLFASKGYRGTVTRDLAEVAGVNISLISYHFKGKEGLYRACLEEFGKNRLNVAQRLLKAPETAEEFRIRLQMFLEETIIALIAEPDLTMMIQREIELENPLASDIFENTFLKMFKALVSFFRAAKEKNIIDPSLDPQTISSMMFAIVSHASRVDRVSEKYFQRTLADPKYRSHLIDHIFRTFITGIQAKK